MKPILLCYASHDGQSLLIAQRLADHLTQAALPVQLCDLKHPMPEANASAIVVVAAVRYGHHLPEAMAFFRQYARQANPLPLAIISVSLNARRGNGEPNSYLKKLLLQFQLSPFAVLSLAGKLDYPRYRWLDKQMIRLIMHLTGGPSDGLCTVEYTNWQHLEAFAQKITSHLCLQSSEG